MDISLPLKHLLAVAQRFTFACLTALLIIRPFISSSAYPAKDTILTLAFLTVIGIQLCIMSILSKRTQNVLLFVLLPVSLQFLLCLRASRIAGMTLYLTGPLLFCAVALLTNQQKNRLLAALLVTATVVSFLGLYQLFFGFAHLSAFLKQNGITSVFIWDSIEKRRIFFPFVTPNALAGYLIMPVPLALMHPPYKPLVFILVVTIVLTQSVGALLSLMAALVIFSKDVWAKPKNSAISLSIFLCVIAAVITLRQIQNPVHFTLSSSMVSRVEYWKQALSLIREHPLVGHGTTIFTIPGTRFAHNMWLQIAFETGFVGVLALVMLYTKIFVRLLKTPFPGTTTAVKPASVALALTVFLLHNLVDFTFFLPEVQIFSWCIAGLAFAPEITPSDGSGQNRP